MEGKYHIEMKPGYSVRQISNPNNYQDNIMVNNYEGLNHVYLVPLSRQLALINKSRYSVGVWKLKTIKQ